MWCLPPCHTLSEPTIAFLCLSLSPPLTIPLKISYLLLLSFFRFAPVALHLPPTMSSNPVLYGVSGIRNCTHVPEECSQFYRTSHSTQGNKSNLIYTKSFNKGLKTLLLDLLVHVDMTDLSAAHPYSSNQLNQSTVEAILSVMNLLSSSNNRLERFAGSCHH